MLSQVDDTNTTRLATRRAAHRRVPSSRAARARPSGAASARTAAAALVAVAARVESEILDGWRWWASRKLAAAET